MSRILFIWQVKFQSFPMVGMAIHYGERIWDSIFYTSFQSFKLFLSLSLNHAPMYSMHSVPGLSRVLQQALVYFLKFIFLQVVEKFFTLSLVLLSRFYNLCSWFLLSLTCSHLLYSFFKE